MKKKVETAYGVIGLGRFGEALAMMLAQSGHEVIAVDKDEKKVKRCGSIQTVHLWQTISALIH
jgi:Trk K+ transport system NAD-binding subunit